VTTKSERWRRYYRETLEREPAATVLAALDAFAAGGRAPGLAIDLGCGNGRDAVEMLGRGWTVLAIDAQSAAIEVLRDRVQPSARCRLRTQVARFEDATWPTALLVNSSFALPLCPAERFDALWTRVVDSLQAGGRFSGQLFGDRDEWVGDPGITFHSRAAAERRLAALEIERFDEEEVDSVTPKGRTKHWHLFHVVARKTAAPRS
jgi:SAM-dependent methyltransferase